MMPPVAVLWWMWPLAWSYVYHKLLEKIYLHFLWNEQEFPKTMLLSESDIPPRPESIFSNDTNPIWIIIQKIEKITSLGYDHIWIACNTVYYYYNDIIKLLKTKKNKITIFDMPNIVCSYIGKYYNWCKIAILWTEATIKVGLYKKKLITFWINIVDIDNEIQKNIDILIKKIKQNWKNLENKKKLINICMKITTDYFLLACTELSMLDIKEKKYIDNVDIMARYIVDLYF